MAEVAIAVSHLLRRDSKQTLQCCGWPLATATHPMHSTSVTESCSISTMQAVISSGQCSRLPYSCTTERGRSGESHSHARPPPSSNIENTANRQNAKSTCVVSIRCAPCDYVFNVVYTFTRHLALTGWMYRCWPSEAGGDWGEGGGGELL